MGRRSVPPQQGAPGIMIHGHQGVSDPGGGSLRLVRPRRVAHALVCVWVEERAREAAPIMSNIVRGLRGLRVDDRCVDRTPHRDENQPAITHDIVAPSSAPSSLGATHRPRCKGHAASGIDGASGRRRALALT